MDWISWRPFLKLIKFQSNTPLPQTQAAFKALVDAIIPETLELAPNQDPVQSCGALVLHTDEFHVWLLNHYLSLNMPILINVYLANAVADMLNIAARQLVDTGANTKPVNPDLVTEEGDFAGLEPSDRHRVIFLLEHLQVDLASLPFPFRGKPEFVLDIISLITLLTTIGYYTEWSGYGSTRLEPPSKRKLEQFPVSWQQVGYPGPSKGYHAFRGYLVDKFSE